MRRLRRDSQSRSGRPRVTVRANYVGLPSMAGRGTDERGESCGDHGRKPCPDPGSTVPRPKIAARGAPRGDAPRSGFRKPAVWRARRRRTCTVWQAQLRRENGPRLSALRPLAFDEGKTTQPLRMRAWRGSPMPGDFRGASTRQKARRSRAKCPKKRGFPVGPSDLTASGGPLI
jgi:hypothetical protein